MLEWQHRLLKLRRWLMVIWPTLDILQRVLEYRQAYPTGSLNYFRCDGRSLTEVYYESHNDSRGMHCLTHFMDHGKWGSGRLNNLAKITQLIGYQVQVQTHVMWSPSWCYFSISIAWLCLKTFSITLKRKRSQENNTSFLYPNPRHSVSTSRISPEAMGMYIRITWIIE